MRIYETSKYARPSNLCNNCDLQQQKQEKVHMKHQNTKGNFARVVGVKNAVQYLIIKKLTGEENAHI